MRSKKTIQETCEDITNSAIDYVCDAYDIHRAKHYPRSLYEEFIGKKRPVNENLSSELGYEWDCCEDNYLA